jgi:hypothetical protein
MNRDNNQGQEQAGGQEKSSTEEQTEVPAVGKASGKTQEASDKGLDTGEEQCTMTYVEQAERLLGRPLSRTATNPEPTPTNDEEMLLDQPYSGIVSNLLVQDDPIATPQPGADAKVKFVSQQQTRTTSGATNVTRTSSSTTAISRTTSGTTNPPSRAASNMTNITDFSSQGGDDQEGGEGGDDADGKKREKRDRSGSSEEADQPPKKKADK